MNYRDLGHMTVPRLCKINIDHFGKTWMLVYSSIELADEPGGRQGIRGGVCCLPLVSTAVNLGYMDQQFVTPQPYEKDPTNVNVVQS
jgi:hypothetical protein